MPLRADTRGLSVILILLSGFGCASDAAIRGEVLDALGSLSKGYKHQNTEEILAVYADDFTLVDPLSRLAVEESASDDVRARRSHGVLDHRGYEQLLQRELEGLARVEKAKYVLDDLRQDGDGYEVDAWFNLYGVTTAGSRCHDESWHRFRFEHIDGDLRVTEHQVLRSHQVEGAVSHFVDRTHDVGLAGRHRPYIEVDGSTPVIPGHFSGSGASAGDIDGDGFLDLIVGDGKASKLFHNQRDGTFKDISEVSGLGKIDAVRGAYFMDVDNDNRLDLFFTRIELPPKLLRNLGNLRFEDVSQNLPGFEGGAGQGESAASADFDGDGDLDIYVVRYGEFDETSWAYPIYDAQDGKPNVALRNRGDGTFEKVDDAALAAPGWGLAVASADYDDDGDQDLYVVNDFGVNYLLRNEGDYRFTDVTAEAGVIDQGFGMGAAFGDYDGDGDLDMYVANMHSSARWVFEDPDFPLPMIADLLRLRPFIRGEMRKVTRGNSLFRNRGDGTFEEVASALGVERVGWAWGANFLDYDNDGDLDVYCPNGFITGALEDDL